MLVILYDKKSKCWLKFEDPVEVITTDRKGDISTCLRNIDKAVSTENLYAAGFITYEAAVAFDDAFSTHRPGKLPLIRFGLYKKAEIITLSENERKIQCLKNWLPSTSISEYHHLIIRIKQYITSGDTYQVNLTTRLHSDFTGDPEALFLDLIKAQPVGYSAFVNMDSHAICSISPELFFTFEDGILTSKPMKGTAPRGRTLNEDNINRQELEHSEKNRAENIMIVDMIRNDMGQIAKTGSVKVKQCFDIEKYPYVWQMTSTVESKVKWSFFEIMNALFPCASITGAPKVRTMEIIKELECAPRGIYTGSIGFITPGQRAQFNVAIRTITIDQVSNTAEYGIGSGIVWDSDTENEYQECLIKAGLLYQENRSFKLFESLLWEPDKGYYLLKQHLKRLTDSAGYFDFMIKPADVEEYLEKASGDMPAQNAKVRLLVDKNGQLELEIDPLTSTELNNLLICIAREPVNSDNPFLFHKTTNRDIYDNAMADNPGFDDVVLWNKKNEITESCRANVVVEIGGDLITPAIECGLLAGTFREHLLLSGQIKEGIISIEDIERSKKIYLINSVRKWMDVKSVVVNKI